MMKKPEPIGPVMRSNILALADAYAKARDLTQKTLSGYCHGDPPFLEKLRGDKKSSITGRKYDHVIGWFFDHWPDDLTMPAIKPVMVAQPKPKKRKPRNGVAAGIPAH